ncbi:hypothetical protein CBL_04458 [Carabus blaptoides fortunei]
MKLAVIFVIFAMASMSWASQTQYGAQPNNIEAQAEFLTVVAEGIFGKVSRFLQAKLNIVLWVKRMIIQSIIRGITYLKYLILHNPTFVNDLISLLADLVRTIVLNLPNLNVPLVAKTLTNLLPYGQ